MDGETCWLNAILQMILSAMDHQSSFEEMNSSLGRQMLSFQGKTLIDSRPIKSLLQHELNTSANRYQEIMEGQQCARDALIILNENKERWMDIYNMLFQSIRQTSTCKHCQNKYSFDIDQLYSEVMCPDDNVNLKDILENTFNNHETVQYRCDVCHVYGHAELQNRIITEASSQFLIIQVKRVIESYNNKTIATENVILFDSSGVPRTYTPIAIIHHRGGFGLNVRTTRHYMADVKCHQDNMWYHTSDASTPTPLREEQVSKKAYVVLYRRVS